MSNEARRGSGRSMATMLAAQLWADDHKVALFQYSGNPTQGVVVKWIGTLQQDIRNNIAVFGVRNLAEVHEKLRGRRFEKILVDHAIVEQSERELAEAIKRLEQLHANELRNLEVIR